jgi:hypothetical protein
MDSNKVTVRKFQEADYPKLADFFIKAYGANTVFQNIDFLKYYFASRNSQNDTACLVAVDEDTKQIISHYGGLFFELTLNNRVVPIVWGVNAYTLAEWRGKGINSKIVDFIHNDNEINAVIGMPFDAPFFYKKLGYHIFSKETLSRFVYLLSEKTFEIIKAMPQDLERAKSLIKVHSKTLTETETFNTVKLDLQNIDKLDLDFGISDTATTNRSIDFLKWRLLKNPYINYNVWGVVKNNKILAYIAIREESLMPQNYKVSRIIDLFGQKKYISNLLNLAKKEAQNKDHIYLDFSVYGELYTEELLNSKFDRLDNEDYSLLPQVTSPIENRPNHEFIVIQSKKYSKELQLLHRHNTYFTRIDADRDRISRISQIKK